MSRGMPERGPQELQLERVGVRERWGDGGCRKVASPSPLAPRSSDSSGGPSTHVCPLSHS